MSIPGGRPIAIVRSEASERCIGAANFADHADHWRRRVEGAGYLTVTIGDARLEAGLDAYAAVILPSVVCLGDAARRELERYVRQGGGMVATWAFGARDANGIWRGYDFLQGLTGAVRFDLGHSEAPWFVSVRTASPLGAGVAGGSRMQVTSPERLEATALEADAFWSDARLRPRDPTLPADYQAAVVRRQLDGGRLVWQGFHESSAVTGETERSSALELNSVVWAAQRPLVAVEPWPSPYLRSVLVAVDVSEYPDGARLLARELAQAHIPATFFVGPSLASDADLVIGLAAAGELALKWQRLADDRPRSHILDRLRLEWARLALWSRSSAWARGVRPFGDTLDDGSGEFLAEAGVRYFVAAGGVDSVLPSSRRVRRGPAWLAGEGSIVGLGRSTDDDLHLSPLGLEGLSPEWIAARILDDRESVRRLGGLYVLSVHSQGLGRPEYLAAVRTALAGLATSHSWIARGEDIAEWWSARSRLRLGVSSPSPAVLRIELANDASQVLENLALVVYPGTLGETPRVRSLTPGPPAQIVVDPGGGRLHLTLPRLGPGRGTTIEITFAG